MKFATLLQELASTWARTRPDERPTNPEVVLIVNGVAHPIGDVWYEHGQGSKGAICIGDDPRRPCTSTLCGSTPMLTTPRG